VWPGWGYCKRQSRKLLQNHFVVHNAADAHYSDEDGMIMDSVVGSLSQELQFEVVC